MPKLIVITVGTSLLTNTGVRPRGTEEHPRIENLETLNGYCQDLLDTGDTEMAPDVFQRLSPFLTEEAIARELSWRTTASPAQSRDRLPQELSYLALITEEWLTEGEIADVALLASNTPNGRLCAQVIADVLHDSRRSARWTRFELLPATDGALFHEIPGLVTDRTGEYEEEEERTVKSVAARAFEHQGLPSLITMLQRLCQERKEVYINLTGGFKGAIPFSTLASAFLKAERVTLHYLFENSDRIIPLPSYPIGLDFGLWHQEAALLQAYQTHPEMYGPALEPRMQPVAEEIRNAGGSPTPGSLPYLLKAQYDTQLQTDPLKRYSQAIIRRLLHPEGPYIGGSTPPGGTPPDNSWPSEEAATLGQKLETLVSQVGDIIWLGDKLPEMVDHALRHHHDLLELTEHFLVPILYHNPDYLNVRERFVLLSTVLLHDSGHSLDRISLEDCRKLEDLFGTITQQGIGSEIMLWPGDIRDYHQYLAGVRLNDVNMAADLGWPHPQGKASLPEGLAKLHQAVILSCLYHRRRMDYDTDSSEANQNDNRLHLTGQWPKSLLTRAAGIEEELGINLMKIVALIRLIDGCDSQARRAGPAARIDLSQSLLVRDYDTAAQRARLALESLPDHERQNIAEEKRDAATGQVTTVWEVKDAHRETRIKRLQALADEAASPEARQAARLWLTAGEAAERAYFRATPWPHYIKHRAVSLVRVLPDRHFTRDHYLFHIVLEPSADTATIEDKRNGIAHTLLEWLDEAEYPVFPPKKPEDPKTLRGVIEREVSSEYDQVAGYAMTHFHLEAHFWWADQWQQFQADGTGGPFYPRSEPPAATEAPSG